MKNINEILFSIEKSIKNEALDEKLVILNLIEAIKILSNEVDSLKKSHREMEDFISTLDEDLGELEAVIGFDEEIEYEEFSQDEFVEKNCANCNESIYLDKEILSSMDSFQCPNCGVPIKF